MISILPYSIGFIILMIYTIISFNIYLKGNYLNPQFILIVIFIFYTSLAYYVISFVDIKATLFEKLIQTIIYFLVGAIFLYYKYSSKLFKSKNIFDYN